MITRLLRPFLMLLAIALLAGCSSGEQGVPSVGGMTECTVEAVQPFITAYVELSDAKNQMPISDLQCADGWAVASGILGPQDAPADGPQGAPTSIILEAEGQFWIIKEKADVCGTYAPDAPEDRPEDALIPADLYRSGCLAG